MTSNPIDWAHIMNEDQKKELLVSAEFREWLIGLLADENRSTVVTFKKKDGTIRKMKCTRNPKYIPEEHQPKTSIEDSGAAIRVFDIEKQEWRSFVVENIMSIDYEF